MASLTRQQAVDAAAAMLFVMGGHNLCKHGGTWSRDRRHGRICMDCGTTLQLRRRWLPPDWGPLWQLGPEDEYLHKLFPGTYVERWEDSTGRPAAW